MSTSTETTPPLSLGEQTKIRLPLIMLVGLLAITATAAITWSGDHKAVGQHEERLGKLEASAADLAVMRNDVLWIRRTLELQQQHDRRQP